jgi:hypothetical protein
MRKLFSIVAAALLTLTANATILNIAPDSPQASDNIRREIRDHIQAGDTLMLADGVYTEADVVELSKDVVIMAAEGAKPIVKQQYYMKMLNSAKVTIIGVKFDGSLYPASDHCIRPYDATEGKTLTLIDCEFTNYPNGYIVYPQRADRCMQTLTIKNCLFENFGRSAIYVETGSSTLPLAEANIENSTFMATTPDSHRVIDIKNDGSEVADAKLRIDHCTFYNCNTVRSEKSTDVIVSNSIFAAPEGATYAATTFYAGAAINNCLTFNVAHTDGPTVTAPVDADPLFVNAAEGNLNLGEGSPALTAAADGGAIGDPRWVPAVAPVEPLMKTIYCKMDKDWWKADGAAVGCYTWNDGGEPKAAWPGERMTPVEGETDIWSIELDINTYHMCIFSRVNGEGDIQDWGAKTSDLLIPTDENDMFTITNDDPSWGDPGCVGVWSKYEKAAPVADWAEIAFSAPATADEIDADASFTVDGFTVAITDPDNKMSIDANNCRFGSAADYKMYSHRLKSGGKSTSTKNFITLTIPEAGTLRIAVRTGTNSATDRNLVLKQGDDTLYNQVIVETMAVKVMEGETEVSVYPFVEVPVEAGTVALSYPVNGLNFYAFAFKAAGGVTPEPVLPSIALIGEMNSWDGSQGAFVVADDKLSASLTLNLAEMPEAEGYAFKLLVDGVAYGSERVEGNPFTFTRENNVLSPVDHIAAGDDEIFWLVMDATGDYTFTYTFADSSLMITYPALAPVEHTYTVAGGSADLFGTTWDPTNAANDMTKQEDGTYKWEKTEQTLPAGAIEFKVVEDHAWTVNYPAENYSLPIPEAGIYTITITYNPEGNVVAGDAVKTGDAVVDPVVSIAGSMNGWNAAADVMTLAEDKATASLTLTLTAQTYEFKVVLNGGDWRSNAHEFTRENASAADMTGNLDNMKLIADIDGDYIFTWTFETNTLVITFPTKEGIDNTAVDAQIIKTIENGQLIIIKNGVKYDVHGTIIR